MEADLTALSVRDLRDALLSEFELVAKGKGLAYSIEIAPGTPETIVTDTQRLRQILKNLLANAFKFTEHGSVRLHIGLSAEGADTETAGAVTDPFCGRLRRQRHGDRYRRGAAAADLRSLRPGRRHHRSSLWRHGTRPVHQPRAGRSARRGDHAHQRRRAGQHLHPLSSGHRSRNVDTPGTGRIGRGHRREQGSGARRSHLGARGRERRAAPRPAGVRQVDRRRPAGDEDPRRRRRLPEHLRPFGAARAGGRRGPHRRERLRGAHHVGARARPSTSS